MGTIANQPRRKNTRPFRQRLLHDVYPFECWTDNGGYHQLFYNGTRIFAPEMVEWCTRSGFDDVAEVIRKAMFTHTDVEYPRSREGRHRALARLSVRVGGGRWDPFDQLNEEFCALLSSNELRYDEAANKWLRETCGVSQLEGPSKAEQGDGRGASGSEL